MIGSQVEYAVGVGRRLMFRQKNPIFLSLMQELLLNVNLPTSIAQVAILAKERFFPRPVEFDEGEIATKTVHEGDVVIEVGANKGGLTRVVSKLVTEKGLVIAFEPNPVCLLTLLHIAKTCQNVKIVNAAVGREPGVGRLCYNIVSDVGASLIRTDCRRQFSVPIVTIDDTLQLIQRKPNVLFIDSEGFEVSVLEGSLATLENLRSVVVEVHHFFGSDAEIKVRSILQPSGFEKTISRILPNPAGDSAYITV